MRSLADRHLYRVGLAAFMLMPFVITFLAFMTLAQTDAADLVVVTPTPTATPLPDPDALYAQGVAAFETGAYGQAIVFLQEALLLVPDSADLHNTLGLALAKTGDFSGAITAFDTALTLEPTLSSAQFNRGRTLHQSKQWAAAEKDFLAVIARDPQPIYYHELGNLYLDWEQIDSAETAYLNALALDINFIDTYFNLSTLYANQGEIKAAIANLSRVILLDNTHLVAHSNLATLHQYQGSNELAQQHWRAVIDLAPESELATEAAAALLALKDS